MTIRYTSPLQASITQQVNEVNPRNSRAHPNQSAAAPLIVSLFVPSNTTLPFYFSSLLLISNTSWEAYINSNNITKPLPRMDHFARYQNYHRRATVPLTFTQQKSTMEKSSFLDLWKVLPIFSVVTNIVFDGDYGGDVHPSCASLHCQHCRRYWLPLLILDLAE